MPQTTAVIKTAKASRYLEQLCKHFAHKLEVEFSADAGAVKLPFGTCELSADAAQLTLVGASQEADLARLESFLGYHLARFAFRENPTIDWQRSA